MSTATETLPAIRPFSFPRLLWVAPVAGLVAGVLNVGVYAIAAAVGVDFLMPQPGVEGLQTLPIVMPVISSTVYAIMAGAVLAGINRFTKNPVRNFLIVVPIAFVLSFVPLLGLPVGVALSTKVALGVMHVVALPIVVGGLLLLGKRKQQ